MMKKSTNPSVYIVTPVFNSVEHTEIFLRSIQKQTYKNLKVVIVDDGSTDGTSQMISRNFPDTILLHGDGNLWWSGGTNKAVKRAMKDRVDYVLTINNDVVVKEDYVESLVKTALSHQDSLIGSLVVYSNNKNKVWYAGATFDMESGNLVHKTGSIKDYNGINDSDWLTGMGVIIPVDVFTKIGLYNEKEYPKYFGDAEFSLRAKEGGYRLLVDTKSVVVADLESNWVDKSFKNPKLSFVRDIFFSVSSPYEFSKRNRFYKKYWPGNKNKALFRLYTKGLRPIYRTWMIKYIRSLKKTKSVNESTK